MVAAQELELPKGARLGWTPNSESQHLFISCPHFEALLHGNRGGGKSMALLADFAQHVGHGFGHAWRGIIFRRQSRDLEDIVAKARAMLKPIFQDADFIAGNAPAIRFATGETLLFRHVDEHNHLDYQGHEYSFVGWEELTQWSTPAAYEAMFGVCRSCRADMPRKYRATCNPSGPGHNWVKRRFIDAGGVGEPIGSGDEVRVHLRLMLEENVDLMRADPSYIRKLKQITDPNRRKAWLEGSWDITDGGMFDDLWTPAVHVAKPFPIPESWRIDRSFDWGSAKPFAVQWWAESDGTGGGDSPIVKRGTLFLIGQWYGSNGQPNEGCRLPDTAIARGILKREADMGIRHRVKPGPADSSIFTKDPNTNDSIAAAMERSGVRWLTADKSPGSRVRGVEMFRRRLAASMQTPMEEPGIFVFDHCRDFIRTVPTLQRDPKNDEDVATEAEDHDWDAARYRMTNIHKPVTTAFLPGLY